jgi:hypothetical protein
MPHSSSSSNSMLTYAVRGGMGPNSLVTLRCLPVEDDGLLQLSGTNPGDAIMGDVDTEPRAGMGQEQQGREGRSQAAGRHRTQCAMSFWFHWPHSRRWGFSLAGTAERV